MTTDEVEDTQSVLPPLENVFFLSIDIIRGIDLKIADLGGSSDPFVKVIANKQSFETKVIMKNLNPEWNESTFFAFFEPVDCIKFEVYDWDKNTKHDTIGECELRTATFYSEDSGGYQGKLDLMKVKKGQIEVAVRGRSIKPLELEQRIKRMSDESQQQKLNINDLDAQIAALNDAKDKLSATKQALIGDQNALKADITGLEQAIADMQQRIQQRENEVSEWKQKQQRLQQQIEETVSEREQCRAEIEKCQLSLQEKNNTKERLSREISDLRAQIANEDENNLA